MPAFFVVSMEVHIRAEAIQESLAALNFVQARTQLVAWLRGWVAELDAYPDRDSLRQPELWNALAAYADLSGDRNLSERFWQVLDRLPAPWIPSEEPLPVPLLGIPILNQAHLLRALLDTLDYPVEVLAIVDNSSNDCSPESESSSALCHELDSIKARGHPLIKSIQIARPFGNLGVAASWNLILSSFPHAPYALIANHDILFAPGVLASAVQRLDCRRPQFLSLLPPPNSFSAFLITCRCWDQLGLFDTNFHPASCEDLDYRDRIAASAGVVDHLDGSFVYPAMAALNSSHSATINSDARYFKHNQTSHALNRLWYQSERRLRRDSRGCWRRLWLAQWSDTP
jgi:hypothetical protein